MTVFICGVVAMELGGGSGGMGGLVVVMKCGETALWGERSGVGLWERERKEYY